MTNLDEYDEDYVVIFEDTDATDFVEYFIRVESNKLVADISRELPLAKASRAEAFSHIAIISQVFRDCGMWSESNSPTVEIQF